MASINTGNQYTQGYGGGYIANRIRNEDKEKSASSEKVEKISAELDQYKKDFVKKVQEMVDKPALANTKINLDIDTETFEKMRTDSAYEKKVLDLLQTKVDKKYPLPPVSIDLTANAQGENAEIIYGNEGELFANRNVLRGMQRSMVRGGVESMREGILSSLQARFGTNNGLLNNNTLSGANTSTDTNPSLFDFYA